jgi:hypothetical protein
VEGLDPDVADRAVEQLVLDRVERDGVAHHDDLERIPIAALDVQPDGRADRAPQQVDRLSHRHVEGGDALDAHDDVSRLQLHDLGRTAALDPDDVQPTDRLGQRYAQTPELPVILDVHLLARRRGEQDGVRVERAEDAVDHRVLDLGERIVFGRVEGHIAEVEVGVELLRDRRQVGLQRQGVDDRRDLEDRPMFADLHVQQRAVFDASEHDGRNAALDRLEASARHALVVDPGPVDVALFDVEQHRPKQRQRAEIVTGDALDAVGGVHALGPHVDVGPVHGDRAAHQGSGGQTEHRQGESDPHLPLLPASGWDLNTSSCHASVRASSPSRDRRRAAPRLGPSEARDRPIMAARGGWSCDDP